MIKLSVSIFFFYLLVGCASVSKFEKTPVSDDDFNLPIEVIKNRFSDVDQYIRENNIGLNIFDWSPGDLSDLENKWGEAESIETHWGRHFLDATGVALIVSGAGSPLFAFVAVEAPFIFPIQTYHWYKGLYHIEVEVSRDMFSGYKKKVNFWEWRQIGLL